MGGFLWGSGRPFLRFHGGAPLWTSRITQANRYAGEHEQYFSESRPNQRTNEKDIFLLLSLEELSKTLMAAWVRAEATLVTPPRHLTPKRD
jgi:hypothetical protein